jgi:hypothetical protein
MHIYNPQEYPNLLQAILLTSEEIKNSVSTDKLIFLRERNKEVEWGIKLPMFVDAFYDYIVKTQTIPNQKDFFDYYLLYNKDFFMNLNRPDLDSGITARVFRTYPSLVRDIYFNKYIEEQLGRKCQIIYNTRLDIEEGIDLMVITQRGNYGICFFTNTYRALTGRKAKEHRHIQFSNVKYVEMPLAFKGSVEAGDFFLYGEKEYNELYKTLNK